MDTPLNASSSTAGTLFSSNIFEIPRFQREYSWGVDEVKDFWSDLKSSIESDAYFLGLVILTKPVKDNAERKFVVDGQQRIITLSLLASAIYHEAKRRDRKALAERVQASFLSGIDYETDENIPRVKLSDVADDKTFQNLVLNGKYISNTEDEESVSSRIKKSYDFLTKSLKEDLAQDPFKRLGKWMEFLTNNLYFAVFIHPDSTSAYQVFEVINTRGKDLTTADLLKNYVLSQTSASDQTQVYERWQRLSKQFSTEGGNNFVQFIRHSVTVRCGHVLPKDLFGFLAGRINSGERTAPTPNELLNILENDLALYLQMVDPTSAGPAETDVIGVFSALGSLGVLAVRPILLACTTSDDAIEGMRYILRLVVRRMVVGNLGTGNVERKFGEAARAINDSKDWRAMIDVLKDLDPSRLDFETQLARRSLNKQVLYLIRRSIIKKTITPHIDGVLHLIWTKQAPFDSMTEEEGLFWMSTIGNTFLSKLDRRSRTIQSWENFKEDMLEHGVEGERVDDLNSIPIWNAATVESIGNELAIVAGEIWYDVE